MKLKKFSLFTVFVGSSIFSWLVISRGASAASLSLGGNYRFGSDMFDNMALSPNIAPGRTSTSSFLEQRILVKPDIIIDDRFTIKSEWNLLQLNNQKNGNQVPPAFGMSFDNQATPLNHLDTVDLWRVYLEWASDWGIFRVGRMPKSWGLGVMYDDGEDPMADYGTTADRIGYQAMLGNLGINVGYEKDAEGLLNNDSDDIDHYEASLDYSNPETFFDVGILYARIVRSTAANTTLKSSHNLSIFSRKKYGSFQMGGEFDLLSQDNLSSAAGILTQFDYQIGSVKIGADFAYASASSSSNFSFNPNYEPFLIMFRQTLGSTKGPGIVRGGPVADGNITASSFGSAVADGTGDGGLLVKGSVEYSFEGKKFDLGTNFGYGALTYQGNNPGTGIGFETDLHVTQKWYDNFKAYYSAGVLFPGNAFLAPTKLGWGVQLRGVLTF